MTLDLAYNAVNHLQNVARATNGSSTAYTTYLYDALNRVSGLIDRKGSDNSILANYTYLYDASSRITSQVVNKKRGQVRMALSPCSAEVFGCLRGPSAPTRFRV